MGRDMLLREERRLLRRALRSKGSGMKKRCRWRVSELPVLLECAWRLRHEFKRQDRPEYVFYLALLYVALSCSALFCPFALGYKHRFCPPRLLHAKLRKNRFFVQKRAIFCLNQDQKTRPLPYSETQAKRGEEHTVPIGETKQGHSLRPQSIEVILSVYPVVRS